MRMFSSRAGIAVVALTVSLSSQGFGQEPRYYVHNLTTTAGLGRAINSGGDVAGYLIGTPDLGYIWWADGSSMQIPLPTDSSAVKFLRPTGINSSGQVVGLAYNAGGARLGAFFYSGGKTGKTTLLPPLSGFTSAEATGLSDIGTVIGYSLSSTVCLATKWVGGSPVALTGFSGQNDSMGFAISQTGVAVGASGSLSALRLNAARWNSSGPSSLTPLTTGYPYAFATAVNSSGIVAGQSYRSILASGQMGGLTTIWSGTSRLGIQAAGYPYSTPHAISESGAIVGDAYSTDWGRSSADGRGFVYMNGRCYLLTASTFDIFNRVVGAPFGINGAGEIVANEFSTNGSTSPLPIVLKPVLVTAITYTPTSVTGGGLVKATIRLNYGVPASGGTVPVYLKSLDSNVTVPASVTVPAGASEASFNAVTKPVATGRNASIKATIGQQSYTGSFLLKAPVPSDLSVAHTTLLAGTSSICTLKLTGKTAVGGAVVKIASSDPVVEGPTSIFIQEGGSGASFTLTAEATSTVKKSTVTATLNGVSVKLAITVVPSV